MVGPHDRHHRIRELDERQDVGADVHVQLHLVELGRRQLARLVEDVLRHRELPGVVQQRGRLDRLQRRLVDDVQRAREADRIRLHAAHVAVRHVVFRVDGHRERFNRGQVQAIHLRDVPVGVLDAPEHGPQRQMKDGNNRQDHRHGAEAHLLSQQNQTEGSRRRRQISEREPVEVLPPDGDRRLFGFQADGDRRQPRVHDEVDDGEAEQRNNERRGRRVALRERRHAGNQEKHARGHPQRQRRRHGVERQPRPPVPSAPRHHNAVDRERHRGGRGPEQQRGRDDKGVGRAHRRLDRGDLDRERPGDQRQERKRRPFERVRGARQRGNRMHDREAAD